MINRRQAVERISLMLGGALSTQITAGLMGQVLNSGASVDVTETMKALLTELADVIIPTTDTPGAKAAGAEAFIIRVMRDCYVLEDQETFYAGLAKIDEASQAAQGKGFVALSPEQKIAIVEDTMKTNKDFFKQMKALTVTGYFTSEIGATQALEYLPIPGKFEGDVPLKPGQKAWAISR
jgi:methylmalonyl-CoA mutase N-terminal domain/subunit